MNITSVSIGSDHIDKNIAKIFEHTLYNSWNNFDIYNSTPFGKSISHV